MSEREFYVVGFDSVHEIEEDADKGAFHTLSSDHSRLVTHEFSLSVI